MNLSTEEIKVLISKYFPFLKNKEIDIFLSLSRYQIIKNKEIILINGRTDKYVILILKGAARAYSIDDKGQELSNYIRAEGHLIGDARVFGKEVQILDVESIGEIHILKFDIHELEILGFNNSGIMRLYLHLMKEIILTLSHRVNTFESMTSKERYLDLIKWNPMYLKFTFDKHLASF